MPADVAARRVQPDADAIAEQARRRQVDVEATARPRAHAARSIALRHGHRSRGLRQHAADEDEARAVARRALEPDGHARPDANRHGLRLHGFPSASSPCARDRVLLGGECERERAEPVGRRGRDARQTTARPRVDAHRLVRDGRLDRPRERERSAVAHGIRPRLQRHDVRGESARGHDDAEHDEEDDRPQQHGVMFSLRAAAPTRPFAAGSRAATVRHVRGPAALARAALSTPNRPCRHVRDGAVFAALRRMEDRGLVIRRRERYALTRRGSEELALTRAVSRLVSGRSNAITSFAALVVGRRRCHDRRAAQGDRGSCAVALPQITQRGQIGGRFFAPLLLHAAFLAQEVAAA